MPICYNCNTQVADDLNFCPECGADQSKVLKAVPSGNTTLLIILCILTFIGSLFTIARALIYELIATEFSNHEYYRGWIYMISSSGTIIGATMMLKRRINGLYVYTVSQVIYLVTVLVAAFIYGGALGSGDMDIPFAFSFGIAMVFFVPSAVFLFLYWSPSVKNHLS